MLVSGASSARAGDIRDVRPTTIERGDTLIIEAPGVRPGEAADVVIRGRSRAGAEALSLQGRGSTADRVLVTVPAGESRRLEAVAIEVRQRAEVWTLRPGHGVTLDLFPSSLRSLASQLGGITPLLGALAIFAVALVLHLLVAPLTGIVVVWERKIWGRMQSRIGPNRVGPGGWLQWLADAIKMITKEDVVPDEADGRLFRFAPYLMWMPVFATFVVLPLSQAAIVADMNVGLLYLVSVTSLTVIAILLGGWTSNSKWSLLGGMRSAAQIVSYELPASLALLQAALVAGTLSPQAIVRAQGGLPHEWLIFTNPFTFAAFFIYFIAALAEGNRTPFDLPEAESELVAGFTTEYSGFRYGVFSLAEWTNVYVIGAIVSAVFLGGWNLPFVSADTIAASLPLQLLSAVVMATKVIALVFVIIWIRATLPRFRLDQLMDLCWKYFIPLSFAAFLGTAVLLWLHPSAPWLAAIVRWATFLVGGVGLLGFFVARVVANFRSSHLLYTGERQFSLPFVIRPLDRLSAPKPRGGDAP